MSLLQEISEFFPERTLPHLSGVTLRHLITHTSGLPAWVDLYTGTSTRDEALERLLSLPLAAAPGARRGGSASGRGHGQGDPVRRGALDPHGAGGRHGLRAVDRQAHARARARLGAAGPDGLRHDSLRAVGLRKRREICQKDGTAEEKRVT